MKRMLAIFLAMTIPFGFSACGSTANNDENSSNVSESQSTDSVDMSNYPSDLNDWSGQNFIDYFKEVGVFTEGDGFETWVQDHETYWSGTPVSECAGWWSDDDTVMVMITILSASNADSSEEQLDEWLNNIKENNTFPGDYASVSIDHLAGNVAFTFETTILDDEIYESFNNAYQELLTSMNIVPEF